MSRILKRPMFRKGGEVMEGVMTGVKPRQNYKIGSGNEGVVENVKNKIITMATSKTCLFLIFIE